MNKFFFLILSIVISCASYSQDANDLDTLYFDLNRHQTPYIDEAKWAIVLRRDTLNKPVGIARTYRIPNWTLSEEGRLTSIEPLTYHGIVIKYDDRGAQTSIDTYDYGQLRLPVAPCHDSIFEILPKVVQKLAPVFSLKESKKVYSLDIPLNISQIVIRFDIRDQSDIPVNWQSVSALAAAYYTGGASLIGLMKADQQPASATDNLFFVTDNYQKVQQFLNQKIDLITDQNMLYYQRDVVSMSHILKAPKAKKIYICIQNRNTLNAAISTLNVIGVSKCKP